VSVSFVCVSQQNVALV